MVAVIYTSRPMVVVSHSVIMPHELHHENMRERANQHHEADKYGAQGEFKNE